MADPGIIPPPRSVRAAETLVLVQAGCAVAMAVLVLQIAGLGRDVALAGIAVVVALWLVSGAALWAMAAVELDHLSNPVRRAVLAVEGASALFLAVRGGWLRPMVVLPVAVAALLLAPPAVHAFVPGTRRSVSGGPPGTVGRRGPVSPPGPAAPR